MTMNYLAFDLGATSGRCILGTLGDNKLELKELTRFPNAMKEVNGALYWDIDALFAELRRGLIVAGSLGIAIESIGIDTWGTDYVCLDENGVATSLPYAYRNPANHGSPERFLRNAMPAEELYRRTGIQHMYFNSVFRLSQHRDEPSHRRAAKFVFLPDALAYMLTGNIVTEYTIATTGAIVNASGKCLDERILSAAGTDIRHFGPLVMPGHVNGLLRTDIAAEAGLPCIPVVSVAGHDTACAVAAIPAPDSDFAFLSSGTWSLMGIETDRPVINTISQAEGFTNEGGAEGTVDVLKNITGMWIVEECLKQWKSEGRNYTYPEMVGLARASRPVCVIDPDNPAFTSPENMPQTIAEVCLRTEQPVPASDGEYIRSIFESMALKYASTLAVLRQLSDHPINRLNIIGGGSRNEVLNQLTADACGIPVVAGPPEATAIGNIMLQAMGKGQAADLADIRRLISASVETTTYYPTKK